MTDILLRPIIAMQVAVHQLREQEDGQTNDRVRDSARLHRYRHHHRSVLPERRAAQSLLERGEQRFAGT
jgi:hypothetical protein